MKFDEFTRCGQVPTLSGIRLPDVDYWLMVSPRRVISQQKTGLKLSPETGKQDAVNNNRA